jgi:hypothetical protein
MPCTIDNVTVTAAAFTPDGVPASVDVRGTLTGSCVAGSVSIAVFDLAGNPLGSAMHVPLSDGMSGSFEYNFKISPTCGSQVEVVIACPRECEFRQPVTVQCCRATGAIYQLRINTPDGRFDQTPQNIQDIATVEGGNNTGIYTLLLSTSLPDPAASIAWTETNLSSGLQVVLPSPVDPLTYSYNFNPPDAASREVEALITYPSACGDIPLSPGVTLRPKGDCASRGGTIDPETGMCTSIPPSTEKEKDPPGKKGPHEPTPPPSESDGCGALRFTAVVAAILTAAAAEVVVCIPEASEVFGYVAIGGGIVTTILTGLYWLFCKNKPCKWALLMAWQVSVGAGWISILFAGCCPTLWGIGGGLIAAGLGGMYLWKAECDKTACDVYKEYAPIITGVVIPFITVVGDFPGLFACIPLLIKVFTGVLAFILTFKLAQCISSDS